MAPVTRSAGKGRVNRDNNTRKDGQGKKSGGNTAKFGSAQKFDVENEACRILELPPEIRNRIYDFAEEKTFDIDDWMDAGPPTLVKEAPPKTSQPLFSARQFFALTQTCKQIRGEFRPLWLRQSSVSIKWANLRPFLDTFYPKTNDYSNGPKLLVISWDHTPYDDVLIDLKPLLQFRALCPTFGVKFLPHIMREGWPMTTPCPECDHDLHSDCLSCCEIHEDIMDERIHEILMEYSYTEALDAFLANKNEDWLRQIRAHAEEIEIECAVDCEGWDLPSPTIFIRFCPSITPPIFDREDMYRSTLRLLHEMGVLDGKQTHRLNFVVGRATGKITRSYDGCRSAVPLYEQVHICGHTALQFHLESQKSSAKDSE